MEDEQAVSGHEMVQAANIGIADQTFYDGHLRATLAIEAVKAKIIDAHEARPLIVRFLGIEVNDV